MDIVRETAATGQPKGRRSPESAAPRSALLRRQVSDETEAQLPRTPPMAAARRAVKPAAAPPPSPQAVPKPQAWRLTPYLPWPAVNRRAAAALQQHRQRMREGRKTATYYDDLEYAATVLELCNRRELADPASGASRMADVLWRAGLLRWFARPDRARLASARFDFAIHAYYSRRLGKLLEIEDARAEREGRETDLALCLRRAGLDTLAELRRRRRAVAEINGPL